MVSASKLCDAGDEKLAARPYRFGAIDCEKTCDDDTAHKIAVLLKLLAPMYSDIVVEEALNSERH